MQTRPLRDGLGGAFGATGKGENMGINMIAISAIFGSGIVGLLVLKSVIRNGARTIDHASKPAKYFYRYALFGVCFLISFMISPALFLQFLPRIDLRQSSEYVQSAAALSYPLPLAAVLYWLLAKLARWSSKRADSYAAVRREKPGHPAGNAALFEEQDPLLAEMDEVTGKMERGEIPLAQAEQRMMALLVQHQQDSKKRLDASKQERAAIRRKNLFTLLALLLTVATACAVLAVALD